MSDKEEQALDLDPEKGATQPLTGGDSPSKVVFTPSTADGPGDAAVEVEISGGERPLSMGLTKEQLLKYANDPTWVRVRTGLFSLFWIVWLAMFVCPVIIIATSDGCPNKPDGSA